MVVCGLIRHTVLYYFYPTQAMSENKTAPDTKRLFLDESGEISFSPRSDCKHFVITVLSVDPSHVHMVKNRLRRQYADFIRRGWPRGQEFKATSLFTRRTFGADTIRSVLTSLTSISSLEVSYIVVNKSKLTNQAFRGAAYGTAYNYFCGVLLSDLIFLDGLSSVHLIVDRRNKETHKHKHFHEYLNTRIFGQAFERDVNVTLEIQEMESHKCYGLLGVDYFSWAIFRKFEYGDSRFFDLFKGKLKRRREWYIIR